MLFLKQKSHGLFIIDSLMSFHEKYKDRNMILVSNFKIKKVLNVDDERTANPLFEKFL